MPPTVHGVDRIEVHCSSTPARDIRTFTEKETEDEGSVASAARSSSSRQRRRGISEPSAPATGSHSKRRLALVTTNSRSAASTPATVLSGSSQEGDVATNLPAFVDVPAADGSGTVERFFIVATRSEERAAQFRLNDDTAAAFNGERFSVKSFISNRDKCTLVAKAL